MLHTGVLEIVALLRAVRMQQRRQVVHSPLRVPLLPGKGFRYLACEVLQQCFPKLYARLVGRRLSHSTHVARQGLHARLCFLEWQPLPLELLQAGERRHPHRFLQAIHKQGPALSGSCRLRRHVPRGASRRQSARLRHHQNLCGCGACMAPPRVVAQCCPKMLSALDKVRWHVHADKDVLALPELKGRELHAQGGTDLLPEVAAQDGLAFGERSAI
mmetsp:Transcript_13388/g.30578  ORF Transcript_13388/g.30578 Transcript_13388/m.30578 type:complete len:216 (-) Transcript_13388:824-1471(-)